MENGKFSAVFSNIGGSLKSIEIKNAETLPVTKIATLQEYQDSPYELVRSDNNSVSYRFINDIVEIQNNYEMSNQNNIVEQEIIIRNISKMSNVNNVELKAFQIDSNLLIKVNSAEAGLSEYGIGSGIKTFRKTGAQKFSQKEARTEETNVSWVGFRNKFYCAVFKPESEVFKYKVNPVSDKKLDIFVYPRSKNLEPGQEISFKSSYYFGLQDQDLLKSYGLGDFVVFSQYGLLDMISKIVIKTVKFMYKFAPNYWIS